MNISPVNYNQNNNKRVSFKMKMTPDTLQLVEKAALGEKHAKMVQDLLNHKGSDSLTAKIVKKGKEFIFGLQHESYQEAREVYPRSWMNSENTYFEKYKELDEYPHVELYAVHPNYYMEIKYTLPNIIENIHNTIFNPAALNFHGTAFKKFIGNTLKPRHNENVKLVNKAHKTYQEINELIKKGQESGRLDEKAVKAIQQEVDKAYNGGKLTQIHFPWTPGCQPNAQHMTLENKLTRSWYKEKIGQLVNPHNGDTSIITVEKKDPLFKRDISEFYLYSFEPKKPEEKKGLHYLNYYLTHVEGA